MSSACPQTSVAEAYLAGELDDAGQERFEEHYFGCDACFRAVQRLQDLQQVLAAERATSPPVIARPDLFPLKPQRSAAGSTAEAATSRSDGRRLRLPGWALAAAASLVAVVALWGARTLLAPPGVPVDTGTQAVSSRPVGDPTVPAPPPPPVRPDPWLALAVVTPPVYAPLRTRSAVTANARAFDAAMAEYAAARYDQAAIALGDLASRHPDDARTQFFLGVSRLLAGDLRLAVPPLSRAASLRTPPYSDEAHFYLAKAALASHDRALARAELQKAIAAGAGPEGDAARLLAALEALPN